MLISRMGLFQIQRNPRQYPIEIQSLAHRALGRCAEHSIPYAQYSIRTE